MIFERPLALAHKLCWNSSDLGISRIHVHNERTFKSWTALKNYCTEIGEDIPEPRYFFDWLEPIKNHVGRARHAYLREYWCNREQIANILLDTAMQAYQHETAQLLRALTGADFENAQLVTFGINNSARKFTGAPDTAFIDPVSGNIALIEIKIGNSSTKYTLDQSVKYETMACLMRSPSFFPGSNVFKVLLGPSARFSNNALKPSSFGPSSEDEGAVSFDYDERALAALRPAGHKNIASIVKARLRTLTGTAEDSDPVETPGVRFYSWGSVEGFCPQGRLKDNIGALMKYLAPEHGSRLQS